MHYDLVPENALSFREQIHARWRSGQVLLACFWLAAGGTSRSGRDGLPKSETYFFWTVKRQSRDGNFTDVIREYLMDISNK